MFRCNRHHQGAHYLSLLSQLKYIDVVNLVVWQQPHHQINHINVF